MGEPVHTVDDYFDQPLRGIADFDGKPHCYEREFDEVTDEYTDIYRLAPVSESVFKLAVEKSQIFDRWLEAFQAGTTTLDTHPALPPERSRYEELQRIVNEHIAEARPNMFRSRGRFLVISDGRGLAGRSEVEWFGLDR